MPTHPEGQKDNAIKSFKSPPYCYKRPCNQISGFLLGSSAGEIHNVAGPDAMWNAVMRSSAPPSMRHPTTSTSDNEAGYDGNYPPLTNCYPSKRGHTAAGVAAAQARNVRPENRAPAPAAIDSCLKDVERQMLKRIKDLEDRFAVAKILNVMSAMSRRRAPASSSAATSLYRIWGVSHGRTVTHNFVKLPTPIVRMCMR